MHRRNHIVRTVISIVSGLLLGVSALRVSAETVVKVGSYQDHVPTIKAFLARHGCQSLKDADVGQNQILSEYLIFCNALKLAETEYRIRLYPYPLNARVLDDIEQGFLDASAMGIWRNELEDKNYRASDALLQRHQFVKGFYTTEDKLAELRSETSLNGHIVLANSNWYHDWRMLECSGLKTVHVDKYENMFRMLNAKRGDMIPLTFSNEPDLERLHFNVSLYPVPGFKMTFDDSTHFAVRVADERANTLLNDLNAGITQLRERGEIAALYRRLGLINPTTNDWKHIGQCSD